MALFQKSVLNKYLEVQEENLIEKQYSLFKSYFHNTTIQKNIIASKEEEFQEGFLRELFVEILGYTINPEPNYNLVTELKNEKDSKKADGAILIDSNVIAVIELKSTTTTDLNKIEIQAFNYKNNQKDCRYVITSNFHKIRFYIDNAIEFLEWDLFKLDIDNFKVLYLCLAKENIHSNLPATIKKESLIEEENITKRLYKEYSSFRKSLFNSIVELNPSIDKLLLFKKTQKLLDRFLFLFFAEDRLLVPPNSVRLILEQWNTLKEMDAYVALYDRFKLYFGYLNTGHKGKLHEIFAYNGGLFAADEVLDEIKINDEILYNATLSLSRYDYNSDVDVNILGHIFEHSLTEIEELEKEIETGDIPDSKTTKRKKDGVFYTPKYITKYIVENTIGTLCKNKKQELSLQEEDYHSLTKKEKKKLYTTLEKYKDWLLKITIVDPACGSGAFLNQALEYLITEHKWISELEANITGSSIVFDIENSILENNLFGVDINEESVEIAKLSLWLRTARKGRKLNSLNNNIKCGNSLIDDETVAGEKAFNWQNEFPKVFDNGGFDVVIGNPPYVNAMELKKSITSKQYDYLKKKYTTAKGTVDLYIYFFEKSLNLLKPDSYLAFITPNRFLSASYGQALREYILNNFQIAALVDYSDKNVFTDASTYPVISILKNSIPNNYVVKTGKVDSDSKTIQLANFPSSKLNVLEESILGFLLNDKLPITEKIIEQSVSLNDVGLISATSTAKEADEYSSLINEQGGFKLVNTGTIDPFATNWGISELVDKGRKILNPYLPKSKEHLSLNRYSLYSSSKILISKIGLTCEAFYDRNGDYSSINTNCIYSFNKDYLPEYILCWLNSKLFNYLFQCLFDGLRMSGGYLLYSAPNLKNTYIKKVDIEQQQLYVQKADMMFSKNEEFQKKSKNFIQLLSSKFIDITINTKLDKWYNLSFVDFSKELAKQKIKLSLQQESEWLQYFEEQRQKALSIKNEIEKTDKEIDQMVYKLYDLTEEEIKIVEAS